MQPILYLKLVISSYYNLKLIKVKFKTNDAVGAFRLDAATDVCSMYPEEPLVSIDIQ